jgi:5'-phosphate synthase pdxT subunit
MKVGVLSFQGAITPHLNMLHKIGVESIRVTNSSTLELSDRLIIPGGESTTMLKLIENNNFFDALDNYLNHKPCWGTCAGAILLAKKVSNPTQKSFSKIEIEAVRNAYGSQLDSFKTKISVPPLNREMEVDFIRAPKLTPLSDKVEIISNYQDQTVLLKQNNILVSSFHTELGNDTGLHEYFCSL